MDSVTDIAPGTYRGTVRGIESGDCTARIAVRRGLGDCRIVDHEAISDAHGLQHIEHGLLTDGALHLAFGEAPGVTIFRTRDAGVYETTEAPLLRIRVGYDGTTLTWVWEWGTSGDDIVERSRATCRLADC
ncbi:hypothetical protein [Flexivirga sp. B27]